MSRQQAPQPVVRPLPLLTSATAVRDLTLSNPINSDGWHEGNFILKNLLVKAGEESIVPLVTIDIKDNIIDLYMQVCDYAGSGHAINATDVTTNVLCDDLPCAVGTSDIDDAINKIVTYLGGLSSDGYELDEHAESERGWEPGARVDAIIDF